MQKEKISKQQAKNISERNRKKKNLNIPDFKNIAIKD